MPDKQYSLMIARFPGNNQEHPASSQWVIQTNQKISKDSRIGAVANWYKSDTPITMVRNLCVKDALSQNIDYLLMIDSDMMPDLPALAGAKPFWDSSWDFMMSRRAYEDAAVGENSEYLAEEALNLMEHGVFMSPVYERGTHRERVSRIAWRRVLDKEGVQGEMIGEDGEVCPLTKWRMPLSAVRTVSGHWRRKYANAFPDLYNPATIAAPYCGPPPHENCYVFEWKTYQSDCPDPEFRLAQIDRESAAIRGGIQEVAALPTGLILYDMRVFKTLPPPWFCYEYADEPYQTAKATTEDVYQTRNASLLKMPQFCNWDAWAGHMKTKRVGKPCLIGVDHVHASLVEAVKRGHRSDEKLHHIEYKPIPDTPPTQEKS